MTAPRFEVVPGAGGPQLRGFAAGGFRIDDGVYEGALLTPESVAAWTPPPLAALTPEHLALLWALAPPPEFLLLGTGPTQAFASRAFVAALEEKGIGVEAMDSRAAARAWNMLRGEGRWIVAALMPL